MVQAVAMPTVPSPRPWHSPTDIRFRIRIRVRFLLFVFFLIYCMCILLSSRAEFAGRS